MSSPKEEPQRRALLGNLGSVFKPRAQPSSSTSSSSSSLSKSSRSPSVPPLDLSKCSFYSTSTISPTTVSAWLSSAPGSSSVEISDPVLVHNFITEKGDYKVAFCSLFFVVLTNPGDKVVYASVLRSSSSSDSMEDEEDDPAASSRPAAGPGSAAVAAAMRQSSPPAKEEGYALGAQGYVLEGKGVGTMPLRDQLLASAPTLAALLQNSKGSARAPCEAAERIQAQLKEHFVEIPGYRYEVTLPSHKWVGGPGLDSKLLFSVAEECKKVLAKENTLLRLEPPVYVIGDLHGNFKDFSYFAKSFGLWSSLEVTPARFLFLGDYVDRGLHSIETLAFVLSLKVRYPEKVFLLRGNHECAEINGDEELYMSGSFKTQCKLTYGMRDGEELWHAFNRCFEQMPLAAVIDNRVFCVHAGIPRYIARNPTCDILATIESIPRPPSITDDLVFDLIWADPATQNEERFCGMDGFPQGFGRNTRGPATCVFGKDAVKKFLEMSGCSHMIRAHQSPKLGVDISKNATILTVFSSSHYCGGFNKAASVLVHDHRLDVILSSSESKESAVLGASDDYRF